MNAGMIVRQASLAVGLLLWVGSLAPALVAAESSGAQRPLSASATLFDLGIWRLDLLMKATARALLNDDWLPGERLESLSGQASYDAERDEIVLRLRAIGWQEPPVSAHRCRETWLGARKQVFWQEGIPFRPKRAEAQTATLLLRQFAHYAVEPRVTARDLQRELLTITRLAITAQGQRKGLVECSAPLVGGDFRILDSSQ